MGEYPHTAMRMLSKLRPELRAWFFNGKDGWVRVFNPLWAAQTIYTLTEPGESPPCAPPSTPNT